MTMESHLDALASLSPDKFYLEEFRYKLNMPTPQVRAICEDLITEGVLSFGVEAVDPFSGRACAVVVGSTIQPKFTHCYNESTESYEQFDTSELESRFFYFLTEKGRGLVGSHSEQKEVVRKTIICTRDTDFLVEWKNDNGTWAEDPFYTKSLPAALRFVKTIGAKEGSYRIVRRITEVRKMDVTQTAWRKSTVVPYSTNE